MAMEYLIIVIIVVLFLTPMWLYLAQVRGQANDRYATAYAKNFVKKLSETADMVHSQSMGAKAKISVFVPENVQGINITGNHIRMKVLTTSGTVDVWEDTMGNLNGTIPAVTGLYWVLVESKGDYVQIGLI